MPSLLAAPTTDCPAADRPAALCRAADRRTVDGSGAAGSPVDRLSGPFSDGDWAVALYEIPEH